MNGAEVALIVLLGLGAVVSAVYPWEIRINLKTRKDDQE